jgi:hypothetical protein
MRRAQGSITSKYRSGSNFSRRNMAFSGKFHWRTFPPALT